MLLRSMSEYTHISMVSIACGLAFDSRIGVFFQSLRKIFKCPGAGTDTVVAGPKGSFPKATEEFSVVHRLVHRYITCHISMVSTACY